MKIAHHYNHAISPPASASATTTTLGSTPLESTTTNLSGSSQPESRGSHEGRGGRTDEKGADGQQPDLPSRKATDGRIEASATQETLQQQRTTTSSSPTPPLGGDEEEGTGETPGSSAISSASADGSHPRSGDDGCKQWSKNNSRQRFSGNSPWRSASETGKRPSTPSSPRTQDGHGVVADDWFVGGHNSDSAVADKLGNPGCSDAAGRRQRQVAAVAARNDERRREQTRLWTRAVGALCSPSHKDLWPVMIDAGILGALYK